MVYNLEQSGLFKALLGGGAVAVMYTEYHSSLDLLGDEVSGAGPVGVRSWCFPNDQEEQEKRCLSWLSSQERARAERFQRAEDRCAYILTRGRLRELLGIAMRCPPERVDLMADLNGKPQLTQGGEKAIVHFNVSHTMGHSLIALSWRGEVGVDLERIDPRVECDALAVRFFHRREHEFLRALPSKERPGAFFRLWARKEALAKALGVGLRLNLSAYDLSGVGEAETIVDVAPTASATAQWRVRDRAAPIGYRAALAYAVADEDKPTLNGCDLLEGPARPG